MVPVDLTQVQESKRRSLCNKLLVKKRQFKGRQIQITTTFKPPRIMDGVLKEVCPGQTVDSEAAQKKAVFFDSTGKTLSEAASRKLKEEIKSVPANHLLVAGTQKYATRSGRVDSKDRLKQVVEDGPRAIYRDLTDKAPLNVPPTNDEDMLLKNDTLKRTGFSWAKASEDTYQLTHQTHLATGMDSKKGGEDKFFRDMKSLTEKYPITKISLPDGGRMCSVKAYTFTLTTICLWPRINVFNWSRSLE